LRLARPRDFVEALAPICRELDCLPLLDA